MSGDQALEGGGILNNGTLALTDSDLVGNTTGTGNGGAVSNIGTLTASGDTLSNNSSLNGGALFNDGSASLTASTVSGNTSGAGPGGGIYDFSTLSVSNSTFAGNTSREWGGALFANGGPVTISNSTFVDNTAQRVLGGGVSSMGEVELSGDIFASDSGGDCWGYGLADNGYNIDDDGSCGFQLPSISDYSTLKLSLGSLADNGGPTETIALLPGDPGIGYEPAADCPTTDQRGYTRPTPCDVGAYDTSGTAPAQPPAATPEVPAAPLLPVTGGLVLSGGVWIGRRRHRRT